jgi:TrmH family RNA methyltransferase
MGRKPEAVLISQRFFQIPAGRCLTDRLLQEGTRIHLAVDRLVHSASGTETSQGILALFPKPNSRNPLDLLRESQLFLVLVDLQDPGNCGALIRSAHAFGSKCLVTAGMTSDPLGPKALRASAGSALHLELLHFHYWKEFVKLAEDCSISMLASVPTSGISPAQSTVSLPVALLVGNEGKGLPQELLALCHETVSLPMDSSLPSLNAAVAGSLILYELSKKNRIGPFIKRDV